MGASAHHKGFLWYQAEDGKIFAKEPGVLGAASSKKAGLGAHRYFGKDKAGKTGTNLIATNIHNHENLW